MPDGRFCCVVRCALSCVVVCCCALSCVVIYYAHQFATHGRVWLPLRRVAMIRQPSPLEAFNVAVALLRQAWNDTVAKSPSKELLVAAEELTTELTSAVVELRLIALRAPRAPTPLQYLPHALGPSAG